jgi:hypothetical protein
VPNELAAKPDVRSAAVPGLSVVQWSWPATAESLLSWARMHALTTCPHPTEAELEHAIFEEELAASASRVGGANPRRLLPADLPADDQDYGAEFAFVSNSLPLRTVVKGKDAAFRVVLSQVLRRQALATPIVCPVRPAHEVLIARLVLIQFSAAC